VLLENTKYEIMQINEDLKFLKLAINKADESVNEGGFPAGAVVVKDGIVIGEGISIGNKLNDPTSHGEMSSIRNACKNIGQSDLSGATLYASMQPCIMCFSASMWSSISRIVYACGSDKVSNKYYGGTYQVSEINDKFNNKIEIVHANELEEESLNVVRKWESLQK
jgi:tRNA(Arg) A34 adenosine deaminase TadA